MLRDSMGYVKCADCRHSFNVHAERPGHPLGLVNSCRVLDTKARYGTNSERVCELWRKADDADIKHFKSIFGAEG